jgi:membrane-bound lytic murein transglycosylase A
MRLTEARFSDLGGWREGDPSKALEAFRRSCVAIQDKAADAPLGRSAYAGTVEEWGEACRTALSLQFPAPQDARVFFETFLVPYRLSQGDAQGHFTGYYEPELKGSRTRHDQFQTPLYGVPPDLVTVDSAIYRDTLRGRSNGVVMMMMSMMMGITMRYVPYPARAEIEQQGLPGEPLMYVDDPIEAFFLEIQGSGRVLLDDGAMVRLAYAGQNGHPYTAIGAVLLERGEILREELSSKSIKAWLAAHPDEAQEVMDTNESYIFFREQPLGDPTIGARGAEGVPLTPEASLAVDLSIHSLGVPVWLEATAPASDEEQPDRSFDRLLVMQDTGGAIRGVIRGDIYWGYGEPAGSIAGRMKHPGRMTVLLPRAVGARLGSAAEIPVPP